MSRFKVFQTLAGIKHPCSFLLNVKLVVLLFPLAYAVVRYNLAAGVSWSQLPLYILNKALAMSSVLALFFAARAGFKGRYDQARDFGRMAQHCALLHVLLTLILLPAGYYPKLSQLLPMASLNGIANLTLFFGLLCAYLFFVISVGHCTGMLHKRLLQYLQLCALAYHLLFLGAYSWFTPTSWPGYLPPVTLLSFIFVLWLTYLLQKAWQKP